MQTAQTSHVHCWTRFSRIKQVVFGRWDQTFPLCPECCDLFLFLFWVPNCTITTSSERSDLVHDVCFLWMFCSCWICYQPATANIYNPVLSWLHFLQLFNILCHYCCSAGAVHNHVQVVQAWNKRWYHSLSHACWKLFWDKLQTGKEFWT